MFRRLCVAVLLAKVSMGGETTHPSTRDILQCRRPGFDTWVRKIPWRRKWQPTPVFLPGESHGQGLTESNTTE